MNDTTTHIVLVRHGQTEWNRFERFRGRADIPLNETGLEQASAVARRLAKWGKVAALYSSPLGRCVQTSEVIAGMIGAELRPLDGLIDIDYGEWQGFTPDEVEQREPALYHQWLDAPQETAIPGGETLDQVRARALDALEATADRHLGQRIVFVSHKVVAKVMMCAVLGLDNAHFWRIEQDNAAINIFERRGRTYLIRLVNDTCHLEDTG